MIDPTKDPTRDSHNTRSTKIFLRSSNPKYEISFSKYMGAPDLLRTRMLLELGKSRSAASIYTNKKREKLEESGL